jgi:hypothetical protein
MNTTILLAHLLGLRDTVTRRLREEERGDVLQTIVLILGFFLLAGIVVAVITAAVNNRTAQIN